MAKFPVEEYTFPEIPLSEIAQGLNNGLTKYFKGVEVKVVDCPDLREAPYNLATKGIGGYSALMDLGGVPYLIPLVNREKVYDLKEIIPSAVGPADKFPDGWYISGAAAGPWPSQGKNCEMVVNIHLGRDGKVINKSKVSLTSEGDELDLTVKDLDETRVALLANLLISSGPGKVLEIKTNGRLDPKTNFSNAIRNALNASFPTKPVGLGGLFMVDYSKTKIHVMRDFTKEPLLSDAAVDNWLKFFQAEPPFLCQSVLVSTDPGLDLRVEHSHGWGTHQGPPEAGHYHYDTAPEDVVYHALFTVAQKMVRVDKPTSTHNIGRD